MTAARWQARDLHLTVRCAVAIACELSSLPLSPVLTRDFWPQQAVVIKAGGLPRLLQLLREDPIRREAALEVLAALFEDNNTLLAQVPSTMRCYAV